MRYDNKPLRHEIKYYINYREYIGLRQRLSVIMQTDKYSDKNGSYHIRSLYFDDVFDSALYEKNYGIFRRQKFRIRIYNKSSSVIKLERKRKYDKYICKESASLTRNEYNKILAGDVDFLVASNNEVKTDFLVKTKTKLLKPKVIVDYVREAYTLRNLNVRVTFDKHLMTGINSVDVFENSLVTANIFDLPVIIMEVKFNEFLPLNIRSLLQISSGENAAISKYVLCRVLKQRKGGRGNG